MTVCHVWVCLFVCLFDSISLIMPNEAIATCYFGRGSNPDVLYDSSTYDALLYYDKYLYSSRST